MFDQSGNVADMSDSTSSKKKVIVPEHPSGNLLLRTLAMPGDTNPAGDIFGGWIMSQIDISGAILDSYVIAGATLTTETFYLRTDNTGTTQGFSNVQDIAVQDFGSSEDHYYIEIAEIYSGNLSDGDIFDYQYKELINSHQNNLKHLIHLLQLVVLLILLLSLF